MEAEGRGRERLASTTRAPEARLFVELDLPLLRGVASRVTLEAVGAPPLARDVDVPLGSGGSRGCGPWVDAGRGWTRVSTQGCKELGDGSGGRTP